MADDLHEILGLLSSAYECELRGPEAFRAGDAVSVEQYIALFEDPDYQWLVCEAPSGRGVEKDGVILGISIFSKNGVSTRNGVNEGKLGSIRLFAVLPRFHGVCIGLRLLKKTESLMYKAGCVRCMSCCSSVRKSVASWFKRRGYLYLGAVPYPFEQLEQYPKKVHTPASESKMEDAATAATAATAVVAPVKLMQFLRKIEDTSAYAVPDKAAGKGDCTSDEVPTVLRLAHDDDAAAMDEDTFRSATEASGDRAGDEGGKGSEFEGETDEEKRTRLGMPYVEGKMHLPPHWRHAVPPPAKTETEELLARMSANASPPATASNGDEDEEDVEDVEIALD